IASIVRRVDEKVAKIRAALKAKGLPPDKDEDAKTLSRIGRALRAIAYGFSAKAKIKMPGFAEIEAGFVAKDMIDREEELARREDPLLDRTLYYNAFEALEKVAGEGGDEDSEGKKKRQGPRVVVFIDDLDRCLPPDAIQLLQSIKLVLAQRGFVFVLAVARRVVEEFLEKRFAKEYGLEGEQETGARYLDKIVQLSLPLPPHQSRFDEYVNKLLAGRVLSHESNAPVKEALAGLIELLARGADYNPRSLVRLINNLIVDQFLWDRVE
ncbi:unnamed protein product, partial [marine sediment metagenome]